jgi:hypothetical protein
MDTDNGFFPKEKRREFPEEANLAGQEGNADARR